MLLGPCDLGPGSAKVASDATIQDFENAMEFAAYCLKASPWWIGDLLNEAYRRFGDQYAQCIPPSISLSQANRLRSVADKIPKANRRPLETLSQGHYDSLARLPAAIQTEFLDKAVTEGLGTNEFRDLISAHLRYVKAQAKERTKGV